MAFDTFPAFLIMGKHGVYVWSAYGFSMLAIAVLTWNTFAHHRKVRNTLMKRYRMDQIR
ncbi:heme exporter protein CcmD [Marinomonas profundimaris]|uniref:Heme exporter protein D n=1 Tax=Marinomonas profundimaris TaxID=1208321 RepID=W1RNJ1_9GAMM|nr:heme exporter protein CcmD [Marinomonas profundimaris]ETI58206.1 hemagglutination activity protein [Marinomonas profundimaris]